MSHSYRLTHGNPLANLHVRIEHDDIEVVAINDPFIDPKYAVRQPL